MTEKTIASSKALELLSNMYICKPSRETIQNWKKALSEDSSLFLSGLKEAIDKINTSSNKELNELLWEYTRLFIGPYRLPCPPWESVYTSEKKLLMQEAYDEIRNCYRNAGLTVDSNDVMPDHIGAELNFLAILLQKTKEAPEAAPQYRNLAKGFLDGHLMKWVGRFTRDMEDASETRFYKTLAVTTRNLVIFENLLTE